CSPTSKKVSIANPIYDAVFKFLMEDERVEEHAARYGLPMTVQNLLRSVMSAEDVAKTTG
ncbi:MAG: hypothetical protein SOY07_07700, partial [Bacteroidales bacterium]|nr:hypothetical protein [Bacteroidales bacterium]